jgi:hypothetical protein
MGVGIDELLAELTKYGEAKRLLVQLVVTPQAVGLTERRRRVMPKFFELPRALEEDLPVVLPVADDFAQ